MFIGIDNQFVVLNLFLITVYRKISFDSTLWIKFRMLLISSNIKHQLQNQLNDFQRVFFSFLNNFQRSRVIKSFEILKYP